MPSFSNTPWAALLRPERRTRRSGGGGCGGGILKMFKLLPMLTTGCKFVGLLSRQGKGTMLGDRATTVTFLGRRRGRVTLAIQEDPRSPATFLIDLPMPTAVLHREMSTGMVRIALESETRTRRRKLLEEHVWAVYVNGRKMGYSIRRREPSDEEGYVIMRLLRGVSMGAGVLPEEEKAKAKAKAAEEDEKMTYLRARFERVVGSKDSEALYMINPDRDGSNGEELSIFIVRV